MYSYAYNLTKRPTSITFNGNTVTFEYFKTRLLKTTFPNGITTDYLFNANSWLTNILTKQGATPLSSFQYSFDNVGNITNKNTEQGNTAYSYDLKYQLTDSIGLTSQEPFTYDAAGNRLTDSSTPAGLTFGTTQFYYNARNRLERVTLPDGRIATYTYDPFGRRIKKDVAGQVTYYAYSDEGLIGEYSATGALIKAYGWKPDSTWGTAPVFMVKNGSYYFYHNDHLGTPQRLTDINGNTVWSATYTAFGEAIVNSASTIVNNLRFPGQYFDQETGLHYNWNRYYNPKTGRYTQEDPIGFGGKGWNLYAYGHNNSLSYIDPQGLKWVKHGNKWYEWHYEYSKEEKKRLRDGFTDMGQSMTDVTVRIPKRLIENYQTIIELTWDITCIFIKGCESPFWHPVFDDPFGPTSAHAEEPPKPKKECK